MYFLHAVAMVGAGLHLKEDIKVGVREQDAGLPGLLLQPLKGKDQVSWLCPHPRVLHAHSLNQPSLTSAEFAVSHTRLFYFSVI